MSVMNMFTHYRCYLPPALGLLPVNIPTTDRDEAQRLALVTYRLLKEP